MVTVRDVWTSTDLKNGQCTPTVLSDNDGLKQEQTIHEYPREQTLGPIYAPMGCD